MNKSYAYCLNPEVISAINQAETVNTGLWVLLHLPITSLDTIYWIFREP